MPRPHRKPATSDRAMTFIRANRLNSAIAKRLGITRQALNFWTEVPWNRVLVVSEITGLPPHEIRPDIYPPPPEIAAISPNARNRKVSAV
jgi:DNA-binding transcriptional regulator YdaS (Cro superfamily)